MKQLYKYIPTSESTPGLSCPEFDRNIRPGMNSEPRKSKRRFLQRDTNAPAHIVEAYFGLLATGVRSEVLAQGTQVAEAMIASRAAVLGRSLSPIRSCEENVVYSFLIDTGLANACFEMENHSPKLGEHPIAAGSEAVDSRW